MYLGGAFLILSFWRFAGILESVNAWFSPHLIIFFLPYFSNIFYASSLFLLLKIQLHTCKMFWSSIQFHSNPPPIFSLFLRLEYFYGSSFKYASSFLCYLQFAVKLSENFNFWYYFFNPRIVFWFFFNSFISLFRFLNFRFILKNINILFFSSSTITTVL